MTRTPLPHPVRESFNCSLDGSRWPYLRQVPPGTPRGVLLFLHGHYGDHHQGMTCEIYNDAFGALREECRQRGWEYITPFYGGNTWMGPAAEQGLAELIMQVRKRLPEVPLYLSGGSMGGSSALVFAIRRPELIDGVLARCPAADIEAYYAWARAANNPTLQNIAAAIRLHYTIEGRDLALQLAARSALRHAARLTMPVHIVHGTADATIPIDGSQRLVAELRRLHHRLYYHEIPGGEHDAPILTVDWAQALDFLVAG